MDRVVDVDRPWWRSCRRSKRSWRLRRDNVGSARNRISRRRFRQLQSKTARQSTEYAATRCAALVVPSLNRLKAGHAGMTLADLVGPCVGCAHGPTCRSRKEFHRSPLPRRLGEQVTETKL